MKTLLIAAAFALASCNSHNSDPTPQHTFHVAARLTGSNLSGTGASFAATSTKGGKGGPSVSGPLTGATLDRTYDLGDFSSADQVRLSVALPSPGAGSAVRGFLVVDGKQVASVGTGAPAMATTFTL